MVKKWMTLWIIYLTVPLLITGCSTNDIAHNTSLNAYSLVSPPEHQLTTANYLAEPPGTSMAASAHPDDEIPGYSTRIFYSSAEAGVALKDHCSLKDRFDRQGLLSYYSEDRRKRLSFHAGGLDQAVLRYSFKLGNGTKRKSDAYDTSCLTDNQMQGVFGSIYHEFNLRGGGNSAFDEIENRLDERGLSF